MVKAVEDGWGCFRLANSLILAVFQVIFLYFFSFSRWKIHISMGNLNCEYIFFLGTPAGKSQAGWTSARGVLSFMEVA